MKLLNSEEKAQVVNIVLDILNKDFDFDNEFLYEMSEEEGKILIINPSTFKDIKIKSDKLKAVSL